MSDEIYIAEGETKVKIVSWKGKTTKWDPYNSLPAKGLLHAELTKLKVLTVGIPSAGK